MDVRTTNSLWLTKSRRFMCQTVPCTCGTTVVSGVVSDDSTRRSVVAMPFCLPPTPKKRSHLSPSHASAARAHVRRGHDHARSDRQQWSTQNTARYRYIHAPPNAPLSKNETDRKKINHDYFAFVFIRQRSKKTTAYVTTFFSPCSLEEQRRSAKPTTNVTTFFAFLARY